MKDVENVHKAWLGRVVRSLWLALLLVAVAAVAAEAAPFAYVTTNSGTVSVIDTATNTVVATVLVGLPARGVAITPNGARAYVTDRVYSPFCDEFSGICYGGWSSSVIDTASKTVVDYVGVTGCGAVNFDPCPPPPPGSVAITPDGAFAYMTFYNRWPANWVAVIETATNTWVAAVRMGSDGIPYGVAVRPDGAIAYVTGDNTAGPNGLVAVINTATKTLAAAVAVGRAPRGVAFTPNSLFAYVANSGSDSVSVIDTVTTTVVGTVPMPVSSSPFGVAITPDGAFAYVTNRTSNTVSVIDTASNTVVGTVPVGTDPGGVAITPDGAFAYVTNRGSNTVSVIATATQTVVATVPVGAEPLEVAMTPF